MSYINPLISSEIQPNNRASLISRPKNYTKLSFVGSLPSFFTFTRASTATYFNSAGVMQTASTNTPRFDYNPATLAARGLLIEGARTNSQRFSGDVTNTATGWTPSFITQVANFGTAPDGTQTSTQHTDTNAAGSSLLSRVPWAVSSTTVTASIFVKKGTITGWIRLIGADVTILTNGATAWFDLTNKVVGSVTARGIGTGVSSAIQDVGNGWIRCSVTFTVAGMTTAVMYLNSATANNSGTRDINLTYEVWGAQLEAGAFASSYIPTTSAAVTRAADVCSTTNLAALGFNPSEGTLLISFQASQIVGTAAGVVFDLGDVTSSDTDRFDIEQSSTQTACNTLVRAAGTTPFSSSKVGTISVGITVKAGLAYAASNYGFVVNNGTVTTSASSAIPSGIVKAAIGTRCNGANPLFGWISSLTIYSIRPPNANLQALTA